MSDQLRTELARIAAVLGAPDTTFILERPRDEGHGDWATNLAMALAKLVAAAELDGLDAGRAGVVDDRLGLAGGHQVGVGEEEDDFRV